MKTIIELVLDNLKTVLCIDEYNAVLVSMVDDVVKTDEQKRALFDCTSIEEQVGLIEDILINKQNKE